MPILFFKRNIFLFRNTVQIVQTQIVIYKRLHPVAMTYITKS